MSEVVADISTVPATMTNLGLNIIGAGILALPISLVTTSVSWGIVILLIVGFLLGSSFALLGIFAGKANATSYRDTGLKLMGPNFAIVFDLVVFTNGFFVCVMFFILCADFFTKGMEGLAPNTVLTTRLPWLVVTLLIVLPLAVQVALDSLKFTSALGLAALLYTVVYVVYMGVRDPDIATENLGENWLYSPSLVYGGTFMGAYHCHYNAPKFYIELANKRDWVKAVLGTFFIVWMTYTAFAVSGVAAFGANVHPDVLTSCDPNEIGVQFALLGMAICILFSYPIVMVATRNSAQDLIVVFFGKPSCSNTVFRYAVTTICTVATLLIACVATNIAIVSSILGYSTVVLFVFVFPTLFYCKLRARGDLNKPLLNVQ